MPRELDSSAYAAVGGHVVQTTASLETGRYVVGIRVDDGACDDVCLTPRRARALARALDRFATRTERLQAALKRKR